MESLENKKSDNENIIIKSEIKKTPKELRKAQREEKLLEKNENVIIHDMCTQSYGHLNIDANTTIIKREWVSIDSLDESFSGKHVWIRCRIQECRSKGSIVFLMLRDRLEIIQGIVDNRSNFVDQKGLKWISNLPLETIVDIYGTVHRPEIEILSATKKIEIHIEKIFSIQKTKIELPFQIKDALNSITQEKTSNETGSQIKVGQDTRLDYRILDLRIHVNQAIFIIQSKVCKFFRDILDSHGFIEIHTPKLISGAPESGASVFETSYFGQKACLAQSPQLHKQMAICADFARIYEIGPVFRAENSNTHRHLCEFTGLDLEMAIIDNYSEVLDVIEECFLYIFQNLNDYCSKEINIVLKHFKTEPFQWIKKTLRLQFNEGIQLLRNAGYNNIPEDITSFDLSTELEKALGKIVKEKYNTDFYVLIRYPLKVRPFYTMPDPTDSNYSNSYDIFMRGEEIISGAQRINDSDLLTKRAIDQNIPISTIQSYIDSFKLACPPHGGCGIGLERVVMFFLGLNNIRYTSLFPRDPKRINP